MISYLQIWHFPNSILFQKYTVFHSPLNLSMNTIEAKIILIGPPSRLFGVLYYVDVGKTSLSCQYVRRRFPENAPSTIGASFLKKNVVIDNTTVVMKIWDTAGQEAYRSSGSLYYNNAEGG